MERPRRTSVAVVLALAGPGLWQALVVLYDRATGNVGSLLHTFEVPGRARFESAAAKPLS